MLSCFSSFFISSSQISQQLICLKLFILLRNRLPNLDCLGDCLISASSVAFLNWEEVKNPWCMADCNAKDTRLRLLKLWESPFSDNISTSRLNDILLFFWSLSVILFYFAVGLSGFSPALKFINSSQENINEIIYNNNQSDKLFYSTIVKQFYINFLRYLSVLISPTGFFSN